MYDGITIFFGNIIVLSFCLLVFSALSESLNANRVTMDTIDRSCNGLLYFLNIWVTF